MLGDRRKARGEFRDTVSALAEAALAGDSAAAEAAIARLGELLPAIRRHHPVLDDAVPLVGYAAGQLLAERETALRAALAVFRSLLAATPFVAELRATLLMVVSENLLRASRKTRERYLVDEAVALGESAVATAEPGSQLRGYLSSILGEAYQVRFRDLGDPADLDRAIDSYRMAADLISTGTGTAAKLPTGEVPAQCLDGLGACLSLKFEQTADLQVLDDAAAAHRRVLQTIPGDDLNRPGHLSKLGAVLHRRYRATGCADALAEAVALSAEAVSTGAPDSTGYASWLNTHAVFLLERYALTEDRSDLERSVTVLRHAARAESAGSASQAMYHSTLGTALITQYHLSTDPAVLAEAVSVHRRAVAATPAGHPARTAGPPRRRSPGDVHPQRGSHHSGRGDRHLSGGAERSTVARLQQRAGTGQSRSRARAAIRNCRWWHRGCQRGHHPAPAGSRLTGRGPPEPGRRGGQSRPAAGAPLPIRPLSGRMRLRPGSPTPAGA